MHTSSHLKRTRLLSLLLLLVAGLALFGSSRLITHAAGGPPQHSTTSKATSALSCGAWSVVPSPNPGQSNSLNAIAAISSSDAWAVGSADGTLTEHWNGKVWSVVPSPSPIEGNDFLNAVTAISTTDVWAVGYTSDIAVPQQTLIEFYC